MKRSVLVAVFTTSLIIAGTHVGDAAALTKANFESPNNQFGKKTSNKVCGGELCKPGKNNLEEIPSFEFASIILSSSIQTTTNQIKSI